MSEAVMPRSASLIICMTEVGCAESPSAAKMEGTAVPMGLEKVIVEE